MTDKRTIQIVAIGLVVIVVVGMVGLFVILFEVIDSATVYDPALLLGFTGLVSGALGGLIGLLGNTHSVDPGVVADTARTQALSDVASLAPSSMPALPDLPLVAAPSGGFLPEPDYGDVPPLSEDDI